MTVASSPQREPVQVSVKLREVRRQTQQQRRWVDGGRLLLWFLVLGAALAGADWLLVLSWPVRAILLAIAAAAWIFLAVQRLSGRGRYDESDAAADVEAGFPQHGQRIRTVHDYSSPDSPTAPAAPGLLRALQSDTRQRTEDADFTTVIDRRPLWWTGLAAIAACFVALLGLFVIPELRIGLVRTLLLPMHYTSLNVEVPKLTIPAGENLQINAEISGRPVNSATVQFREAGSEDEWQELPLALIATNAPREAVTDNETAPPTKIHGKLAATVLNCQQDLDLRVVAGELQSEPIHIRVLQPLFMEKFAATIESPSYTNIAPQKSEAMDLKVIEGAKLDFQLTLNRAPAEAQLVPVGLKPEEQVSVSAPRALTIRENQLTGRFDNLRQTRQFVIRAKAADGMAFESGRLRIRVQPDAKPTIRFVKPPEELEVTPTTEITLAVDAGDDFGIQKLGVLCKVAGGETKTLWEKEFPSPEKKPQELQVEPVLFLENHELTFQDAVTYYAFVEDNYPGGEPRRAMTELRFIDIRPFKREYQVMKSSGGT